MDLVKLLLNFNALSDYRGMTGYDGAIELAEEKGHLTVVGLIRQHETNDENGGTKNLPILITAGTRLPRVQL